MTILTFTLQIQAHAKNATKSQMTCVVTTQKSTSILQI